LPSSEVTISAACSRRRRRDPRRWCIDWSDATGVEILLQDLVVDQLVSEMTPILTFLTSPMSTRLAASALPGARTALEEQRPRSVPSLQEIYVPSRTSE
jgi:hypothetical protein